MEIKGLGTVQRLTGSFPDYRSTGPLCMFAKGKALLKLSNQLPQYLISNDTYNCLYAERYTTIAPYWF